MTLEDTVSGIIERTTAEALADSRLQALLSGRMGRSQLTQFFQHFMVTHLNSVQVLSFLFSVAPPDGTELVRENLLEEMGLEEAEKSHPEMLLDLARGLGFTDQRIAQLRAEAGETRRAFAAAPVAYRNLKDLGLSMLLETVTFETFLSRVSDRLATALVHHYQVSREAVRWFTHHGDVDVRHAEEGRRVVLAYLSFHRFTAAEVERIVRQTFVGNAILNRYFPSGPAAAPSSGPARVVLVEILPLSIPFHRAFDHAKMSRSRSDAVVVRLTGSDGLRGYGEALPRPYVTGEDRAATVSMLRTTFAPEALRMAFEPGMEVLDRLRSLGALRAKTSSTASGVAAWNATWGAMEMALLDWTFKRAGLSLSEWLVPAREQVVYSGVIDAADPEMAKSLAARYAEARIAKVKVKVGIGDDAARLEAVRSAGGDQMGIRVDANGAWTAPQAIAELKALCSFGIEAVEQPVAARDLSGMRRVREEVGLPVIADESLVTMNNAESLVQERACDIFNIRVSKCGGILTSKAMAELGLAAGLKVQIGAQVGETSLLSAAGRHLAAHLPQVEYVEGSFGVHLLSEDVTPEPVMFGYQGRGDLLLGTGLGVAVDDGALERLATEKFTVQL